MARKSFDVAVIGAGIFGAWTAYWLRKAGRSVALVDQYGPGNSRSSSGGETRIIRLGYGNDALYSRWAQRALTFWQDFADETGEAVFHRTGVLWLSDDADDYTRRSLEVLRAIGAKAETCSQAEIRERWPQVASDDITWALHEPGSGVLMARSATQAVARRAESRGVECITGAVQPCELRGRVESIRLQDGTAIAARAFVFACGPWLPRVLRDTMGARLFVTRQEVFFFGAPPGDTRFEPSSLPAWLRHGEDVYGMPDIERRGVKISLDRHGPPFDPDRDSRIVSAESVEAMRAVVGRRFPALKDAPIVETRVCQYENSSNGDFLIDRHPDCENVWIAGGGSGHGFKHGPVVGEYCAALVRGKAEVEPRFTFATKRDVQQRTVY